MTPWWKWEVDILGTKFNVAFSVWILVVLAVCAADAWWDWPWE